MKISTTEGVGSKHRRAHTGPLPPQANRNSRYAICSSFQRYLLERHQKQVLRLVHFRVVGDKSRLHSMTSGQNVKSPVFVSYALKCRSGGAAAPREK